MRSLERRHWLELGVRSDATLNELDRFLRGVWLECCGHISHFEILGVVYSTMAPMPGEKGLFEPMDEREARWRHMVSAINATVPSSTRLRHEFDYGAPTNLVLEHVATFEGLVQTLFPLQPWHGGKIVVLARNHPLQSCLNCGHPAEWKIVQDRYAYEDPDDEVS